jgi:hypothetical protein
MILRFLLVEGLGPPPLPAEPDLDPLVEADDLELVIKDLPAEAYESSTK